MFVRHLFTRRGAGLLAAALLAGALAPAAANAAESTTDGAAIGSAAIGSAAAETYGDYSMMGVRSAGQIWGSGRPASQWAWDPKGGGESHIRWDRPSEWNKPASNIEHFIHEGDWVYLHGWEDRRHGVYYTQHVTSESIGDGNCQNMQPLPSSGERQHYVKWNIQSTPYCLLAKGYITGSNGTLVQNFAHRQIWSGPKDCVSNKYLGKLRCIQQHERWASDNNEHHVFTVEVERDNYLGKGRGMGFIMNQQVKDGKPNTWRGDLHNTWRY